MLIANVGENIIEDRQLTVGRRYVQSALAHQTKKANGLEGDRLAPCIRASNHEGSKFAAQMDIDGDHMTFKEGMARPLDQQPPFRDQLGFRPLHVQGQAALGGDEVQLRQNGQRLFNLVHLIIDEPCQLVEDPLYLFGLLPFQLPQLVVEGHYRSRFDEQSCSTRRLVMDDPGEVPLVFLFHRQNKAPAPHSDYGILQHPAPMGGAKVALQVISDPVLAAALTRPDAAQGGTCAINDVPILRQTPA